jgi:hypothetical protein
VNEIYGDLMAFHGRKGYIICITTNGFITKDGRGVMGRGCAKEAADMDSTLPGLLGKSLRAKGNILSRLTQDLISFPVKHQWFEDADPKLIRTSAIALKEMALVTPEIKFILPRPGCGNGGLDWEKIVKPLLEEVNLPNNVVIISFWEDRPK